MPLPTLPKYELPPYVPPLLGASLKEIVNLHFANLLYCLVACGRTWTCRSNSPQITRLELANGKFGFVPQNLSLYVVHGFRVTCT
jgi:hypothetical protein